MSRTGLCNLALLVHAEEERLSNVAATERATIQGARGETVNDGRAGSAGSMAVRVGPAGTAQMQEGDRAVGARCPSGSGPQKDLFTLLRPLIRPEKVS